MKELEEKIEEVFANKTNRIFSIIEILKKICKLQEVTSEDKEDVASVTIQEKDGHLYIESVTNVFDGLILADNFRDLNIDNDERILVKLIKDPNNTDPNNKKYIGAEYIKTICNLPDLEKTVNYMVQEGIAYEDSKNQYRLFPSDMGYIQSTITISNTLEGYIELPNGGRYYIHPNDLNEALNGDIVVARPTNKVFNGDIVAKVDKIIKRKDGILIVKVVEKNNKKSLKPTNAKINHPILLDGISLFNFNEGDTLAVQLEQLGNDGAYHVKYIKTIINVEKDEDREDHIKSKVEFNPIKNNLQNRTADTELTLKLFKANKTKKFTFNELYKKLSKQTNLNDLYLQNILEELELQGQIYYNNGYYRAFPFELGYVQGILTINKFDEGIVTLANGKKYIIDTSNLNDALDGDLVVIKAINTRKHNYTNAVVDKIVKRKDGLVVVEVCKDGDEYYLKPFNAILSHPIKINSMSMKLLVEGDRIVVKIAERSENDCYYAGFVKNIGHKNDPDADLKIIAIENDIVIEFSEQAIKEAENIPTEVSEEEKDGRLDLTKEIIFSIDSAKTKDRDDAISIKINENGNYIVGVHISDVTHYVHPRMQLWKEALFRGTSVYMADTVIPMIPHKLSNGICSLNEGVDRLTFSCIMEVTPQGQILNYDFVDSVINSKKAMTYDDVNNILEDGIIPEGYEEFVGILQEMNILSTNLEKLKIRRGFVDFGTNDLEIDINEEGTPIKFRQREQRTAEKLIENFMLLANECYATYVHIPTPLRVHEKPDTEKVEEAFELLNKSGIKVKSCHDIVNGKVIQQILAQIKDTSERNIAADIILRTMKRARYDVDRIGHFGLALENYGHWTSPIRRAADLRGHYNLRMQRDNLFNCDDYETLYKNMENFCEHISTRELKADTAEKTANSLEMVKYINNHIGEKFVAHVTYINNRIIFVKTEQGIGGKILPYDIDGDIFTFNDRSLSFNGNSTHIKIKIGTKLVITALDTNREFKTINFGVSEEDLPLILTKKSYHTK